MLSLLLAAALGFSADGDETGAGFTFHDSATCDGRSVLHFRTLEFAKTPVRPITLAVPAGSGALYGLLPVGSDPDAALAVVWDPTASGGPELWVDGNGDGKLTVEEGHAFANKEIDIPVFVTVRSGDEARRLPRTIIFRRSAVGGGLSYAVRGYASGTLNVGGKDYAALLTDGNADGCFDGAGSDRVWIDLNGDGHFDGLAEQFLLGSPISVDGRVYIVRSNATASEVRAEARSTARGSARLTLTDGQKVPVADVAVQLVSDLGEVVEIRDLMRPASLPVGCYRVDSVRFRLTDGGGGTWSYRFVGGRGRRYGMRVEAGKETEAVLLSGLALELSVAPTGGAVTPGQRLEVTPHMRTRSGLYLADCCVAANDALPPVTCSAAIRLVAEGGGTLDQALSTFT